MTYDGELRVSSKPFNLSTCFFLSGHCAVVYYPSPRAHREFSFFSFHLQFLYYGRSAGVAGAHMSHRDISGFYQEPSLGFSFRDLVRTEP